MAARATNKLSYTRVAKLKTPGIYEDGAGLRLIVDARLNKRWVARVTIAGKRRQRGLGSFPSVSLEAARKRNGELRTAARRPLEPLSGSTSDALAKPQPIRY
ncbi:MAG: Arm DNA-binding domain-containing protein, partial [Pseudomonadota bacterium]